MNDGIEIGVERGVDGENEDDKPSIDVGCDGGPDRLDQDTEDDDGHPATEVGTDDEEHPNGHLDVVRRLVRLADFGAGVANLDEDGDVGEEDDEETGEVDAEEEDDGKLPGGDRRCGLCEEGFCLVNGGGTVVYGVLKIS